MEDAEEYDDCAVDEASELVEVLDEVSAIAVTQRPVFLVCRRGTGPLLLAETIHRASLRPNGPFITVRCGLNPPATVDLKLFGSRGGTARRGKRVSGGILAADGGTLFVEQVQNASMEAQRALLQILDDQEFTSGGSTRTVDIRVIVSAPASLEGDVAEGRFRADLFYRLNVMPIPLPGELVTREAMLGIIDAARRACLAGGGIRSSPTPGTANTDRLRQALRAAMDGAGQYATLEELLLRTLGALHPRDPGELARKQLEVAVVRAATQCVANRASFGPKIYDMLLVEVQRALIRRAIEECSGMRSCAAALLGLTLAELELRIGELGLLRPAQK